MSLESIKNRFSNTGSAIASGTSTEIQAAYRDSGNESFDQQRQLGLLGNLGAVSECTGDFTNSSSNSSEESFTQDDLRNSKQIAKTVKDI